MVLAANAWMQHPVGFTLSPTGAPVDVDRLGRLRQPGVGADGRALDAVVLSGGRLRGGRQLRVDAVAPAGRLTATRGSALTIAMAVGTIAAIAQPLTGDLLAKRAHHQQPAKLAAVEALLPDRSAAHR